MKLLILIAASVACADAFVPPGSFGNPKRAYVISMADKIIDMSNIEYVEDDGPLSDGINPKKMGVTMVKAITEPFDITCQEPKISEPKIFEFKGKTKIDKHSHPGSGQYFVTDGSITVSTADEKKTYEKGDMFIVPKDLEYDLENTDDGDATVFYVYWSAEEPV